MYTVEINMPNLAKGVPVEVDGLGTFDNGSTYEVSDDEALAFRQKHVHVETTYGEEGQMHNEFILGPTLDEAFKESVTIKVKKGKADKRASGEEPALPGLTIPGEGEDNA